MTNVPSSDGQSWDIQDTSPWAQDSGGIATGPRKFAAASSVENQAIGRRLCGEGR